MQLAQLFFSLGPVLFGKRTGPFAKRTGPFGKRTGPFAKRNGPFGKRNYIEHNKIAKKKHKILHLKVLLGN